MAAYIVDNHRFTLTETYPDSSYASFAMSDNYGWEPDNKYSMIHDENALYEYWLERMEDTGVFYEGLGVSDDKKHDMFKDWMEQ